MMFWKHVSKRLSAYLHGELMPEESRRVSEHLMSCRRCRDEYEEIKFGARLAAQLTEEKAPAALWEELEGALDKLDTLDYWRRRGGRASRKSRFRPSSSPRPRRWS
jgi:anti-sigma factor RsiW